MTQIKVNWTAEMQEELERIMSSYTMPDTFEYKFENDVEKSIIEKNFEIDYITDDTIYFKMDSQLVRKIKILIFEENELSNAIKKILIDSKPANAANLMADKLSDELAEIDRQILKDGY